MKTFENLSGIIAKSIMLKQAKKEAINEIKAFRMRLKSSPKKQLICWRLKFDDGTFMLKDMTTGKVIKKITPTGKTVFLTSSDILSREPVGKTLVIDKEVYIYGTINGVPRYAKK